MLFICKNGVYRETLPLRVPAGVTVQGESLRGTEIRPASGTGHQVKTVTITSNGTGAANGTYNYVHANATIFKRFWYRVLLLLM